MSEKSLFDRLLNPPYGGIVTIDSLHQLCWRFIADPTANYEEKIDLNKNYDKRVEEAEHMIDRLVKEARKKYGWNLYGAFINVSYSNHDKSLGLGITIFQLMHIRVQENNQLIEKTQKENALVTGMELETKEDK